MSGYFFQLVSDNYCFLCGKEINFGENICSQCEKKLSNIKNGYEPCPVCSYNLKDSQYPYVCQCNTKSFIFEFNYSILPMEENIHLAFINAKYKKNKLIAMNMIEQLLKYVPQEKLNFFKNNIDYIIYIPISKIKLKKRNYSVVKIFALKLSKIINKKIISPFKEKGEIYLHLSSNRDETNFDFSSKYSLKNFSFRYKKHLNNKNILLVDDVFTTGNTVNYISKILKQKFHVNKIYVITLLRARFKKNGTSSRIHPDNI